MFITSKWYQRAVAVMSPSTITFSPGLYTRFWGMKTLVHWQLTRAETSLRSSEPLFVKMNEWRGMVYRGIPLKSYPVSEKIWELFWALPRVGFMKKTNNSDKNESASEARRIATSRRTFKRGELPGLKRVFTMELWVDYNSAPPRQRMSATSRHVQREAAKP